MKTTLKVIKTKGLMDLGYLIDKEWYTPNEIGFCLGREALEALNNLVDTLEKEGVIQNSKDNLECIGTEFADIVSKFNIVMILYLQFYGECYKFIVEDHDKELHFIAIDEE